MLFLKFSLLFLFIINSQANFSEYDCLNTNFATEIKHKSALFGLLENKLLIEKTKCSITITHSKWTHLKNKWLIDVCRAPVHIKEGVDSIDVLKRTVYCREATNDKFCKEYFKLKSILQDDGLIFAAGEKEDLDVDHGKVFCVFSAFESYLKEGKVLSRFEKREVPKVKVQSSPIQRDEKPSEKEAAPTLQVEEAAKGSSI